MSILEIILLGAALSMDAVAVGMTNGMTQPKMRLPRAVETAGAFGLFQFFMPLAGYELGAVFAHYIVKIAPVFSFAILAFLGGKMIYECIKELVHRGKRSLAEKEKKNAALKLFVQAFATSIDALAVGITLLALEASGTLALPALFVSLVIGGVTFVLSLIAVLVGKKAGSLLADKAEILGGAVLVFIGLKIFLESI